MTEPTPTSFTILTGFLGAGKTTLLRHLLSAQHDQKLAIIVNELGEIGIDGSLVLDDVPDRILEMNNGCVCCEVREDLVTAIMQLFDARQRGTIEFDHIVMETTGVARPAPIVETLHSPALKKLLRLNGIITVVDAFHITSQLNEFSEAQEQIGVADYVLLNKSDLQQLDALDQIEQRITKMNQYAMIQRSNQCQVETKTLFDLSNKVIRGIDTNFKISFTPLQSSAIDLKAGATHLAHIQSLSIEINKPLQQELLLDWFSFLIMRYEERLLRFKGILDFKGQDQRTVFQGIHSLFEAKADRAWHKDEQRLSRFVFIGRDLPEDDIRSGINACIAP